jgi:hypothetical protein
MPYTVTPHELGVADHAAPATRATVDPAAVAQYSATLLPAVLWLLGVYVFDGGVPMPLQGAVGLLVTALCTALVRWVRHV